MLILEKKKFNEKKTETNVNRFRNTIILLNDSMTSKCVNKTAIICLTL